MSDLKLKKTKDGVFVTGLLPGKSNIEKIVIPNQNDGGEVVTGICPGAFEGNKRIKSVSIPQTVREIGEGAFFGCDNIVELHIEDLKAWCEVELRDEYSQPLFHGQNGYRGIGQIKNGELFLNDELVTELEIPSSVTTVSSFAFAGCTHIKSIIAHKNVTDLAFCCFLGLTSLERVDFADARANLGEGAFAFCFSLGSVTGTDHLLSIGVSAFHACSSLSSITISDSVTSIGRDAFVDCSSLTSVVIGTGVHMISDELFSGCRSLTSIIIPGSVTSVGRYAFSDCTSLKSITVPDSVKSIGIYAFFGCSALTDVYITDFRRWCSIDFENSYANPLSYATNLYLGNGLLRIGDILNIPQGVRHVGNYAFCGFATLMGVVIPGSVISIGENAFFGCTSLTSVYYRESPSVWPVIIVNDINNCT